MSFIVLLLGMSSGNADLNKHLHFFYCSVYIIYKVTNNIEHEINDPFYFIRPKQVEIYGTVYKAGAVVVGGHDGIRPVFARIQTILGLPDSRIVFFCKNCVTQRFVSHLGAYEIYIMNDICLRSYESFYDYHPLHLYILPYQRASRKFVRLRYWIHE